MKKRTRKVYRSLFWTIVLLLVAGLLAACGGGATQPEAAAEAPAAEESTATEAEQPAAEEPAAEEAAGEAGAEMADSIRISSVAGAMHDVLVELAERYEEANPGVTVTVEDEPEGGAFQALIAAGNQPDLVITSFGPALGQF